MKAEERADNIAKQASVYQGHDGNETIVAHRFVDTYDLALEQIRQAEREAMEMVFEKVIELYDGRVSVYRDEIKILRNKMLSNSPTKEE